MFQNNLEMWQIFIKPKYNPAKKDSQPEMESYVLIVQEVPECSNTLLQVKVLQLKCYLSKSTKVLSPK